MESMSPLRYGISCREAQSVTVDTVCALVDKPKEANTASAQTEDRCQYLHADRLSRMEILRILMPKGDGEVASCRIVRCSSKATNHTSGSPGPKTISTLRFEHRRTGKVSGRGRAPDLHMQGCDTADLFAGVYTLVQAG